MKNLWTKIALFYFLLVGIFGLLWRALGLYDIPFLELTHLRHAHSHTAFQGWVYSILFVAIFHIYNIEKLQNKKTYILLFWLAQFSILGVSISFPIQGYAFYSILFSSIFVIFSYIFAYRLFRDLPKIPDIKLQHPLSFAYLKAGIFYFVFSSLGLWAIGPILAKGLKGSVFYPLSVYFYLHFQYNGAFTFIIFALFFWILEKEKMIFPKKSAWRFFWFLNIACIPSFLLSSLWTKPPFFVVLISAFSALLLLIAWFYFFDVIRKTSLKALKSSWVRVIIYTSLLFFSMKLFMQTLAAIPYIAIKVASMKHSIVVGYLHFSLIGFISLMIIAFLIYTQKINLNLLSKIGLSLFFVGFILTETMLFGQGAMIWFRWGFITQQNRILFWLTILMPLGLLFLFIAQFLPSPKAIAVNER